MARAHGIKANQVFGYVSGVPGAMIGLPANTIVAELIGRENNMDKKAKLHKLCSELAVIDNTLKDFVTPRSANYPNEWTQVEAEKHRSLAKNRNDFIAEIAQLEASP